MAILVIATEARSPIRLAGLPLMFSLLRQYALLLWLILLSLLAAVWPEIPGTDAVFDPFLQTKPILGWFVAITMFCVGTVLPKDEVRDVLWKWPLILGGTAVQFISMPALAWILTSLIPLERELSVGVILVGCVPGAMASNVLTLLARGNVSYSVGLTTSATLLSPVIVPLALRLTLGTAADSSLLVASSLLLCQQIVLPTLLGFALSQLWEGFSRGAQLLAPPLANVSILWIIAVVVALNRARLYELSPALVVILPLLNVFGYLAGNLGARLMRLNTGMRRALTLEVGMQNAGVGASLATSLFPEQPGVALPCGLFAFGCMLTGTMLAQYFGQQPHEVAESQPVAATE